MASQVDIARRSLGRVRPLHQARTCLFTSRRVFSSVSSFNASNSELQTPSRSTSITHQSLVTSVPNLQALQRMRWLLQQPHRRVLLLTGSSASDSCVRVALERDLSAFELERRGHGVFGVHEFCQLLLRESGRERRIFSRAQLMALLMHNGLDLRSVAPTSTLQRRKGAQDLLQLFQLLEREGVTPEEYSSVAKDPVPQELAKMYGKYQELLIQQQVTSWDGLVLDMVTMCRRQEAEGEILARDLSQSLVREYTDVVVDEMQRMTPAMTTFVGHVCGQPTVQSSASFSRVFLEGGKCPRTQTLEQQLLATAASTGRKCTLDCIELEEELNDLEKRRKMQGFAQRILTRSPNDDALAPIPFQCWHFDDSKTEEKSVGAYLAQANEATNVTVLCPTRADAHRLTLAFHKQKLFAPLDGTQFRTTDYSTGLHLFDEPGVNVVYSMLCALRFPSDSRHLYNVLRSDLFAFPAELLSWLMENESRRHVDLFAVIEAFVASRGKSLGTFITQREDEEQELPPTVSCQLETGLESAQSFVTIIKRLRAKCHQVSAVEMVQSFLEETGRLETLLSPTSLDEEHEAVALAAFLRELETAQKVVKSDQVTFVVPYLQQLQETSLTLSSADTSSYVSPTTTARGASVRVLPLTAYALQSYVSSVMNEEEEGQRQVLVLMSMRDSKFPGRMKRLTLPLPYELLSKPLPVQSRLQHLESCEELAYQALTLVELDEVVLSFADLTATSGAKREVLSRTFEPIWHQGDQPADPTSSKGSTNATSNTLSRHTAISNESASSTEHMTSLPHKTMNFWLSEMAELLRSVVKHVFRPMQQHDKLDSAAVSPPPTKRSDDHVNKHHHQQETPCRKESSTTTSLRQSSSCRSHTDIHGSGASAATIAFEPSHLSYSQISEYLRCPHRYYLSRIMKLNGELSPSMMFGRALHEGVAAFANSLAVVQPNEAMTQERKTLAAVKATEAFTQSWAHDGLFTCTKQSSFLFDRGILALQDFMAKHWQDAHTDAILHVEQAFSFDVPSANVELRGVWDRIDRVRDPKDEDSWLYVIKEFKSNMSSVKRNMEKLAAESLQLQMYMYAFYNVYGEAPYGAKLQQIGPNLSSQFRPSRTPRSQSSNKDKGLVLFSEQAMKQVEDVIVDVASSLRRGDFEPTPSFAECGFCPYAGSACRARTDTIGTLIGKKS